MPRTLVSYKGERIRIADNAIYSGGEGDIHTVLETDRKRVAKLYHSTEKAKAFHQKILFMVNNPPFGSASKAVSEAVVWPEDLLFENNVFVGYVMPMVEGGIKLFMLTLPKLLVRENPLVWAKFAPNNPDSLLIRLKICYNLARAIDLLHQSGKYVLVDMKPENVLIKPNGHFSIIDLDSIQIVQNKKMLFHATAFTPEYTPAELHQGKLEFGQDMIPATFDHFSLAVIIYQLLLNIHPFQASHDKYTSIEENIRHGLFVHGKRKKELAVIPAIHGRFNQLPKKIQNLFIKALEKGYLRPASRPAPMAWADTILYELNPFSPFKLWLFRKKHTAPTKKNKQDTRANLAPKSEQPISIGFHNLVHKSAKLLGKMLAVISGIVKTKQVYTKPKRPSAVFLSRIKWYIAFALLVIGSTTLVYYSFPGNIRKEAYAPEIEIINQLPGRYYGMISSNGALGRVAYLHIYQAEDDSSMFAIRLVSNVMHQSIVEELMVVPNKQAVQSVSLGNGLIKRESNGKIILMSNKYNPLSWHFVK